eukprot:scaffold5.g734.t1
MAAGELHEAARRGDTAAIQRLLAADPGAAAAVDRRGPYCCNVAAMQLLLAAAPETAMAADEQGWLPLHWAAVRAAHGHILAARVLLERSAAIAPAELIADLLEAEGNEGAVSPCHHVVCTLLVDLAASRVLSPANWAALPSPCLGLACALPSVLGRSPAEAAQLVAHLPDAARGRLRTLALSLAHLQRQLELELPEGIVRRILVAAPLEEEWQKQLQGERRGGGRDGGGGGPGEDQYGETMQSQDRNTHFHSAGRGGGAAGGSAGGSARPDHDVSFQRHVPKFLAQYAHMLGRGAQAEGEPVVVNRREVEEEEEDDEDEDALRHAVQQDPSLLAKHPELQRARSADLKTAGNKAFAAKDYDKVVRAAELFGQAIACDPNDPVFYSNRSAALAALKRWSEAAKDARRATELKPSWAKAWGRLGAARLGASEFSAAVEAYEKAAQLEPDSAELASALARARAAEEQAVAERRHRFKRKDPEPPPRRARGEGGGRDAGGADGGRGGGGANGGSRGVAGGRGGLVVNAPAVKKQQLLSFGDDEEGRE